MQIVAGGLHWLSTLQLRPDEPLELEVVVAPLEDEVAVVAEPLLELEDAAGHWHEPLTGLQVNGVHWALEVH